MIKVDGNEVEIKIKNFNIGELLKEYSILSFSVYNILNKDFPDDVRRFELILKEITNKNNFSIEYEESKIERVVSKCDS